MNNSALPFISIIIVNYNGKRYLEDCFNSLYAVDYPEDRREIILVDNASTDGSAEYVNGRFPGIRVVRSAVNKGFSGGNNVGIEHAVGEFFALLNNDTVVDSGWLERLVDVAVRDPKAGIVTSKILFRNRPNVINNAGSRVMDNGWGGDRGFGEVDTGQYDRTEEVFCACGASMLLRREMVEQIGTFDPSFFCYYEDTDLSWRARLAGWKVVYTHRSVIYHVHAGTSVEWSPLFTYYVLRNRLFMLIKNAWLGLFMKSFKIFIGNTVRSMWLMMLGRGKQAGCYLNVGIRIKVIASFLRHLPVLLSRRRKIRSTAMVGDNEIKAWLVSAKVNQ